LRWEIQHRKWFLALAGCQMPTQLLSPPTEQDIVGQDKD